MSKLLRRHVFRRTTSIDRKGCYPSGQVLRMIVSDRSRRLKGFSVGRRLLARKISISQWIFPYDRISRKRSVTGVQQPVRIRSEICTILCRVWMDSSKVVQRQRISIPQPWSSVHPKGTSAPERLSGLLPRRLQLGTTTNVTSLRNQRRTYQRR